MGKNSSSSIFVCPIILNLITWLSPSPQKKTTPLLSATSYQCFNPCIWTVHRFLILYWFFSSIKPDGHDPVLITIDLHTLNVIYRVDRIPCFSVQYCSWKGRVKDGMISQDVLQLILGSKVCGKKTRKWKESLLKNMKIVTQSTCILAYLTMTVHGPFKWNLHKYLISWLLLKESIL